jgi:hypothetical protein
MQKRKGASETKFTYFHHSGTVGIGTFVRGAGAHGHSARNKAMHLNSWASMGLSGAPIDAREARRTRFHGHASRFKTFRQFKRKHL